ncbi:MAG TPA: pyridoxal-phosphate dependent enzyme [Nevskiaceae bacterium]|nr:pyridoxal-phosphate dependent enzyme [Nevskiaceae bacterium]
MQKKTEQDKNSSFYVDLEKLLRQQLQVEPRSKDLRLKLLELYFDTSRSEDFLREARNLAQDIRNKSSSAEWQRAANMGRMLLPDHDLFRLEIADKVEFIEQSAPAVRQRVKKRFGEGHAAYFERLGKDYDAVRTDPKFLADLDLQLVHVANRPSSLMHAQRLSEYLGGAQIYFKREDLSPAGTYLTISVCGQALLAKKLGRTTLVSASSNGLRGVITASVAARLGLKCVIYMDGKDMHLQSSNVFRMWLMGATVTAADPHTYHKGDVRETALEHCARDGSCFMVLGLDAAPQPYPMMGLEFAAVIGRETRRQLAGARRVPSLLVARAGENADAIGFFQPFLREPQPRLACVATRSEFTREASATHDPFKAPLSAAEKLRAGVIMEGLEYPSVTREHAWLKASGRVDYVDISEDAVKKAIGDCGRLEGLIPPIQTAHAIAWAIAEARRMEPTETVAVILRESMDRDIWEIGRAMGVPL